MLNPWSDDDVDDDVVVVVMMSRRRQQEPPQADEKSRSSGSHLMSPEQRVKRGNIMVHGNVLTELMGHLIKVQMMNG